MTGPRRDCQHPRARHMHGTENAYTHDRCRCDTCFTAHAKRIKLWRHAHHARQLAGVLCGRVPADGTRRRLQALATVGWSTTQIATRLGVSQQRVSDLRAHHGWTHPRLAARVAAVYEQLWDVRPTGSGATRTRQHADAAGWLPPMCWDDDTIDNPATDPRQAAKWRAAA